MSYNDSYGRGDGGQGGYGYQQENRGNESRQEYGRQDQSEYGGGGRGSDNYYNQQPSYNDADSRYQQGDSYYQQSGNNEYQGALSHAHQHSSYGGSSSDESSLFSNALSFLSGNKQQIVQDDNFNESQALDAHQALYGEGRHQQQHNSETVGAGAAMQALKMFTGGGSGAGHTGSQGGGNSQNQFIGMAMAQASSLFDKQSSQGNVVSWTFLLPYLFLQLALVHANSPPRIFLALTYNFSSGSLVLETKRSKRCCENGTENVYEESRWWWGRPRGIDGYGKQIYVSHGIKRGM